MEASYLADRQVGNLQEDNGTGEPEIRFPDWKRILTERATPTERVVTFPLEALDTTSMLRDIVQAVMYDSAHVIAVRYDARETTFWLYDNDSEARLVRKAIRKDAIGVARYQGLRGNRTVTALVEAGSDLEEFAYRQRLLNREAQEPMNVE